MGISARALETRTSVTAKPGVVQDRTAEAMTLVPAKGICKCRIFLRRIAATNWVITSVKYQMHLLRSPL